MEFNNKMLQPMLVRIGNLFKSDNVIIGLGILTIIPLIILSIYIHPNTDDFCYNCKIQELGYWNAQLNIYNNWNGRYFTTAILTIKELVSGSFIVYKMIPIFLLLILFSSIYYLSSVIFVNLKKRDFLILTFYFLIIYLVKIPNLSEGIYWLSGSICYQLSNILMINLLIFLIKLEQTNKIKYLILSIVFTIMIIGSNEISMLLIDFLFGVLFFYKLINHKKINYSLLILLVVALIFSFIVINAPSNSIRGLNYPESHDLFSIKQSIFTIKRNLEKWLPFILLITFIFYDYFNKKVEIMSSKIFKVNPFFIFIIICCILFIGFFTGFWAMGIAPPDRAINTIYFYFLIGFVYLFFALFFKLKDSNVQFISFSKWVKYLLLILIFIHLTDKGSKNNIRLAYSDLFSGRAYKYDLELKSRYKKIENSKNDTCYVPKLTVIPYTIFSTDITSDPSNWINKCYGSYYRPNKIIIKKE